MRQLFKFSTSYKFKKERIVSAETIWGNTVDRGSAHPLLSQLWKIFGCLGYTLLVNSIYIIKQRSSNVTWILYFLLSMQYSVPILNITFIHIVLCFSAIYTRRVARQNGICWPKKELSWFDFGFHETLQNFSSFRRYFSMGSKSYLNELKFC